MTLYKMTGRASRLKHYTSDGHFRYHVIRSKVDMELIVDWQALADHFAAKLATSKGGRSKLLGGIIKAKRTNIAETGE